MDVTLVNSGTTPASDVNATLIPSSPVYAIGAGSLTRSIGLFPVGQTFPLTFTLGILNSSAAMNSTLTLSVQSPGAKALRFTIPFTEQPRANFQVVSLEASSVSIGDSSDSVGVVVGNTGAAEADFTAMTMLASNVFQPSIPTSASPLLAGSYLNATLGTVLPGQMRTGTFVIQVSSNIAPGTYPLSFILSWRQPGSPTPFVKEVTVQVNIQQTEVGAITSALTGNPIVLLVLLAVIVAVVVVLFRRRRAQVAARPAQAAPPTSAGSGPWSGGGGGRPSETPPQTRG